MSELGGQAPKSDVISQSLSSRVGYVDGLMSITSGKGRAAWSVSSLESRRDVSIIVDRAGEGG